MFSRHAVKFKYEITVHYLKSFVPASSKKVKYYAIGWKRGKKRTGVSEPAKEVIINEVDKEKVYEWEHTFEITGTLFKTRGNGFKKKMIVFMLHELDEQKKKKKVIGKADIDLGAMSSATEPKVHNVDRLMLVGKKKTFLYVTIRSCPRSMAQENGGDELSALSTYTGVDGCTEIVLDNEVDDEDEDLQLDELDNMRWKRMSQQCETLKHQTALLEGTITMLEKDNAKLKSKLEEENKTAPAAAAVDHGQKDIDEWKDKVKTLTSQLDQQLKLVAEKTTQIARLEKQQQEKQQRQTPTKSSNNSSQTIQTQQETIEAQKATIDQLNQQILSLNKKLETINESHDQLLQQVLNAKKSMKTLKDQLQDAQEDQLGMKKTLDETKTNETKLGEKVNTLSIQFDKVTSYCTQLKEEIVHRQILDQYILFNTESLGSAIYGISEIVELLRQQGTTSIFAKNIIASLNYKILSQRDFSHAGYWCQWVNTFIQTLIQEKMLDQVALEKLFASKQNAHKIKLAEKTMPFPSLISMTGTDVEAVLTNDAFLKSLSSKLVAAYQYMLQPMLAELDNKLINTIFCKQQRLASSIEDDQGKDIVVAFEKALADHFAQVKATFSEELSMHVFHDLLRYLDARLFNHLLTTCVKKGSVPANYMINLKMGMSVIENYYELSLKLPINLDMTRDVFNVMLTSIPNDIMEFKSSICPHLSDEHIQCFLMSNNVSSTDIPDNDEEIMNVNTPTHVSGLHPLEKEEAISRLSYCPSIDLQNHYVLKKRFYALVEGPVFTVHASSPLA